MGTTMMDFEKPLEELHDQLTKAKQIQEKGKVNVQAAIKDLEDKISADEKLAIETAVKAVEEAIKGDDIPAITDSVEALTKAAEPLFKAYQANEAAKQAEVQPGAQTDSAKPDNVVDAEFTEVKKDAE